MEKKFTLTDKTMQFNGKTLYRIKALKSFGNVKKYDIGGWVESEDNLSQYGNCWVYNEAKVMDNALVHEDAQVSGHAEISDEASDEVKKYLEGFKMIYTNLIKLLTDLGVKEIEASGMEFNPNYHQAVLTEKDGNKPSNVILEVLQKGYIYKDKVIRPAMVKVNE